MAMPTNQQLWESWIKTQPTYQSRISMASKEVFTDRGFAEIMRTAPAAVNDFINAHVIWVLNAILPSRVRGWWQRHDCTETFTQPYGGMTQRLYGTTAVEVSPGYLNLKNGDARSPWITSYPENDESRWYMNDNYQGLLTVRRDQYKEVFLGQRGVAEYVAAQLMGLENSYTLHVDKVLDQALHTMLSDSLLTDQQTVQVNTTAWNNAQQLVDLFAAVGQVLEAMDSESVNSGWNMKGFETVQDKARLRLLVRPQLLAGMKFYTNPGAYNPEYYNLGIPVIPKQNFGGITYAAAEAIGTTVKAGDPLYVVYTQDELHTIVKAPSGHRGVGLAASADATTPITYSGDSDVSIVDPHANTLAVLLDKGTIFSVIQNPYRVEPWGPNPRTLQINYWANAENNGRYYDRAYTCVKFDQVASSGS